MARSSAKEISGPSSIRTARDWVFVALLDFATLPNACRSDWLAAAFIVATFSTSAVWWLGYNGSGLPIIMLLGIYWVASASHTRTFGRDTQAFAEVWRGLTNAEIRQSLRMSAATGDGHAYPHVK